MRRNRAVAYVGLLVCAANAAVRTTVAEQLKPCPAYTACEIDGECLKFNPACMCWKVPEWGGGYCMKGGV